MYRRWVWVLLVASAIVGGCATSGAPMSSSRGAYPGCPPDSYFPNANCYGGPP
jgi:hypothetical protein